MRYFLPDSQDLVDPSFDFVTEKRARTRLRQRDDRYAHEVFREPAFDGILVSKGIVDGFGASGGRYTMAQRQRLFRTGVRAFFRLPEAGLPVMGDCGAFTYVKEPEPPYTVDDVIAFYVDCGFDLGISVDHVILAYDASLDESDAVPDDLRQRQEITLTLARAFLETSRRQKVPFIPLGVAQGWSPQSYTASVAELQRIGFDYVAVGGMVPLKTHEILAILQGIETVRLPRTQLHLLGVTRTERVREFAALGVTSFDSTSPLRQAFKDDRDNYYTLDRTYVALRVPQVEGNPGLQRRIASGAVSQDVARRCEKTCLALLDDFARGRARLESVLDALLEYERLYDPRGRGHEAAYRETLEAQPWELCPCDICKAIGHHVILFRGAERNRRRGFHNVWTFYRRLQRALPKTAPAQARLDRVATSATGTDS